MLTSRTSWQVILVAVCITSGLLLSFKILNVIISSDQSREARSLRKVQAETIAREMVRLIEESDKATITNYIDATVANDQEMLSMGIRRANGDVFAQTVRHFDEWRGPSDGSSTINFLQVPVYGGQDLWGRVEISYRPIRPVKAVNWLRGPWVIVLLITMLASFVLFIVSFRLTKHKS